MGFAWMVFSLLFVHDLYWWPAPRACKARHWLFLETFLCWCSLLRRWYCSYSPFAICCSAHASNMLWVCQLSLNTSKIQLIEFSCCPSSRCGLADFSFNGEKFRYSKTVKHLGYILSNDLSDNPEIIAIKQSMCCKAKSKLMQSFCLSLYGSALWPASSELHSLAVSFNNILR